MKLNRVTLLLSGFSPDCIRINSGTIYAPKCEQELWRIQINKAIKLKNVTRYCDFSQNQETGIAEHVIRTEDAHIPEMILNTKMEGGHGFGRPKT
jgi:hypothetical protein